jgi:hypothetical protein
LRHYRKVPRMTITFESDELEIVERACRNLAEMARRDAEGCKGNSVEQIHRRTQARWLRMAERIKVARNTPEPEPPPSNVRPIR